LTQKCRGDWLIGYGVYRAAMQKEVQPVVSQSMRLFQKRANKQRQTHTERKARQRLIYVILQYTIQTHFIQHTLEDRQATVYEKSARRDANTARWL